MVRPQLKHSSHEGHVLTWTVRGEKPYTCDGCKEEGFHPCYQCTENGCNFHLHEQCAVDHHSRTTHKFFADTLFVFHNRSLPRRSIGFCVACGKGVKGFRYQSLCSRLHVIHPCCLKLRLVLTAHQGDQVVNLELFEKTNLYSLKKCLRCKQRKISEKIDGWVYVSGKGDFCYHVGCIQDFFLDKWKTDQGQDLNGYLERQTLQLAIEHNILPRRKVRKIHWAIKMPLHLLITAILGEAIAEIINHIF